MRGLVAVELEGEILGRVGKRKGNMRGVTELIHTLLPLLLLVES